MRIRFTGPPRNERGWIDGWINEGDGRKEEETIGSERNASHIKKNVYGSLHSLTSILSPFSHILLFVP